MPSTLQVTPHNILNACKINKIQFDEIFCRFIVETNGYKKIINRATGIKVVYKIMLKKRLLIICKVYLIDFMK